MMKLKVDARKRVTIPCVEPGQQFSVQEDENGVVTLTPTPNGEAFTKAELEGMARRLDEEFGVCAEAMRRKKG